MTDLAPTSSPLADQDNVPLSILRGFVPANYSQTKGAVLCNELRALKRIHGNRVWEDWLCLLHAFALLTKEIATEVGEKDPRNVNTTKGSPFQRRPSQFF
jgi:hypothetical protein